MLNKIMLDCTGSSALMYQVRRVCVRSRPATVTLAILFCISTLIYITRHSEHNKYDDIDGGQQLVDMVRALNYRQSRRISFALITQSLYYHMRQKTSSNAPPNSDHLR